MKAWFVNLKLWLENGQIHDCSSGWLVTWSCRSNGTCPQKFENWNLIEHCYTRIEILAILQVRNYNYLSRAFPFTFIIMLNFVSFLFLVCFLKRGVPGHPIHPSPQSALAQESKLDHWLMQFKSWLGHDGIWAAVGIQVSVQ